MAFLGVCHELFDVTSTRDRKGYAAFACLHEACDAL